MHTNTITNAHKKCDSPRWTWSKGDRNRLSRYFLCGVWNCFDHLECDEQCEHACLIKFGPFIVHQSDSIEICSMWIYFFSLSPQLKFQSKYASIVVSDTNCKRWFIKFDATAFSIYRMQCSRLDWQAIDGTNREDEKKTYSQQTQHHIILDAIRQVMNFYTKFFRITIHAVQRARCGSLWKNRQSTHF